METWEVITGIILLIVGMVMFLQNYHTVNQCNSLGGKISTAISSIFGGTGAQSCYNSQISEIAGILIALMGLGIVYLGAKHSDRKRRMR